MAEPFEADAQGAIQRVLQAKYKCFGWHRIPQRFEVPKALTEATVDFLREVWQAYGDLTGYRLTQIIQEGSPWAKARRGLRVWEQGDGIILPADMQMFFREQDNAIDASLAKN